MIKNLNKKVLKIKNNIIKEHKNASTKVAFAVKD